MEKDDIITKRGYPTTRVPVTTSTDDRGRQRIIPTVVSMVFLAPKGCGVQRTMPCRMSELAAVPMSGGNNLPPLGEILLLLRPIVDIHVTQPLLIRGDVSVVTAWIRPRGVIPCIPRPMVWIRGRCTSRSGKPPNAIVMRPGRILTWVQTGAPSTVGVVSSTRLESTSRRERGANRIKVAPGARTTGCLVGMSGPCPFLPRRISMGRGIRRAGNWDKSCRRVRPWRGDVAGAVVVEPGGIVVSPSGGNSELGIPGSGNPIRG